MQSEALSLMGRETRHILQDERVQSSVGTEQFHQSRVMHCVARGLRAQCGFQEADLP